jgi:hypothetical protein
MQDPSKDPIGDETDYLEARLMPSLTPRTVLNTPLLGIVGDKHRKEQQERTGEAHQQKLAAWRTSQMDGLHEGHAPSDVLVRSWLILIGVVLAVIGVGVIAHLLFPSFGSGL